MAVTPTQAAHPAVPAAADNAPTLGPDLSIAHAATTRERLLEILASQSGDLCLDLGAVSDIDSSGVQLLLSTRLSLQQQGLALRLAPCSTAVRAALSTFGLDALLGDGADKRPSHRQDNDDLAYPTA